MTADPINPAVVQARLDADSGQIQAIKEQLLSQLHWWSRPDFPNLLTQVENLTTACLQYLVGLAAGSNQLADVTKIVKERREKLALQTGITDQIIGICQQILAFGAAGLALTIGFIDKIRSLSVGVQKALAIVGIFYVELVVVSLLVLALYMLQARFRYPFIYFREIGNTWPWFYYAPIYTPVCRTPIQTAATRIEASATYAVDLLKFARRCVTETPEERLRVEMQQYFLLIMYQGYANQFSLRLANLFFYGFTGSIVSTLVLFLLVRFRIFQ